MKRKITRRLLILAILIVGGFIYWKLNAYFDKQPPKQPEQLRTLIVESIENPFNKAETFIIETDWAFCGNSYSWEIPIVFDTKLEENSNKLKLAKRLGVPIVTMSEFQLTMDSISNSKYFNSYVPNLWDTCRVNKVHAEIHAEKLSSKNVCTYETYQFNNEVKFIKKNFEFISSKWTYKILDSLTRDEK